MSIRSIVKRIVPSRIYRFAKNYVEGVHSRRIASLKNTPPTEGIHVCYAERIEAEGAVIRGGAVKLLALRRAFPADSTRFNILYLVSSALPKGLKGWIALAKKSGAKVVLNQNGVGYPGWAGSGYVEVNEKIREAIIAADYITYQTIFCRDTAWKWVLKSDTEHRILTNAVDCELFTPAVKRTDGGTLRLLAAGSHEEPTRVEMVLKTLAAVHRIGIKANLILAGRIPWDPDGAIVMKMLNELNLQGSVERVPPYTRDAAPALFRRADILIHTKYKDPCPTVVLEAMACGLPVVGSASGGMPELVSGRSGVLLSVPDSWEKLCYPSADECAQALQTVWGAYELFSKNARREAVEFFSEQGWVEANRKIFMDVLNK